MGGVVGGIIFLIILLIPTPLILALFCSSIPSSLFIFKTFFFHSCIYNLFRSIVHIRTTVNILIN